MQSITSSIIRFGVLISLFFCLTTSTSLGREVVNFCDGWQFVKSDIGLGAKDATWHNVTIPHSWNTQDGQDGGGSRADVSAGYHRGACWYRKTFKTPADLSQKRVFLKFEAASITTNVFLSGTHLGQHKGAFTAFCYEITDTLKNNAENLLEVKVDNSLDLDIAPLSGDFTMFGGIYRPIWLIITDKTCITPLDYASSGVYLCPKDVSESTATIEILTKIDSSDTTSHPVEVISHILDAKSRPVTKVSKTVNLAPGERQDVTQSVTIDKPHLWNGRKNPYLYTVVVKMRQNGKVIDTVTQPLGIRTFRVDAKKGFFLNGESHQLRGVNRHQDRRDKGWAISSRDHKSDHDMICEIGANTVRLAHYPHSNEFLNMCDRSGLLVWAELPLVNQITDSEAFSRNAEQQLIELIRQQYNHPSIFCWSLWNELMHKTSPNPVKLIQHLHAVAKAEDPGRYTAAGANGASSKAKGLRECTDLIAWNVYPGWYGGHPSELGKKMDHCNQLNQNKGVGISEYGAGGSINHHEQGMTKSPKPTGKWHPEQWQAILHEQSYEQIQKRDYLWGTFIWNMFDFASVWRTEGDTDGINDKGLVTYDRKVKKDAFFFYKANWNPEPIVYISSRRHVERKEAKTEVKVYSNAAEVELFVNGKSQGKTSPNTVKIFQWENVELTPGKNNIQAVAVKDEKTLKDACQWNLKTE